MTDYSHEITQIKAARSLAEIREIVRSLSAKAGDEGGILYSGAVGKVPSEVIAKELAHKSGLPIINDTPRARFLGSRLAQIAIGEKVEQLLTGQGVPLGQMKSAASDFLYGNGTLPPENPLSIRNSLWGEASAEFAASLRGPVVVVASAANAERVLGQVEVPTVLHASRASSLGDRALPALRDLHAQGGMRAVLPEIQASFIDASTRGVFVEPRLFGLPITQVTVSREAAVALHLDGSKFFRAATLTEAGFVPAPMAKTVSIRQHLADVPRVAEPLYSIRSASRGLVPEFVRGGTVLSAAAVAWNATTTARDTATLLQQGNATGAASAIEHFGSRNLGMLGGAMLGAQVLGAAGIESGPLDLVAATVGGIGGAIAGDKVADAYDQHKIHTQTDAQGRTWHHDPQHPEHGWTREVPSGEIGYPANHPVIGYSVMPAPTWRRVQADPALAARLTFQANNTAVELALEHVATPRDPYTQPATAQDAPSRLAAPWQRDAASGSWSRTITDAVLEHGLKSTHVETATPSRSAELDAAAQATLAANLAHSRRGIAARYQAIYDQRGWQQLGAMPGAVTDALHAPTNTLDASDGHTYTRDAQGTWSTPGRLWGRNAAEGNLRMELDASAQLIATTFAAERAMHTATHATSQASAQVDAPPIPPHLHDFRHPGHPLHATYDTLLQHVHAMEDRVRMPHGEHSERAAAALLDRHSADRLGPAARVELHGEGKTTAMHLVTNERAAKQAYATVERRTPISVFDVVARSVADVSRDWSRRELPHLYQPTPRTAEARPRDPSTLDPCDLRHRDHPRHAAFVSMREHIGAAYARYGIARSADQLDRATAAVMRDLPAHARLPDQVQLLPDTQTGRFGPDSGVLTRDSSSFLPCTTTTHTAAMQQAPDALFRQFDPLAAPQPMQPAQMQTQVMGL